MSMHVRVIPFGEVKHVTRVEAVDQERATVAWKRSNMKIT